MCGKSRCQSVVVGLLAKLRLWGSRYALPRSVCRANCKLNKANELQAVRGGAGEGGREQEERREEAGRGAGEREQRGR